jgi:hypothetical protein
MSNLPLIHPKTKKNLYNRSDTVLALFAGAYPTIASYNASVVKFYNARGSLARFENKKYLILPRKTH